MDSLKTPTLAVLLGAWGWFPTLVVNADRNRFIPIGSEVFQIVFFKCHDDV